MSLPAQPLQAPTATAPQAPSIDGRQNPWRGLAYYEPADAPRFAGRRRDVEAVANGILNNRTFVLFGRSGLGKTSLLLAGVFPRLRELDPACRTVYVRVLDDPLNDLLRALGAQLGAERAGAGADLRALVADAGRGGGARERLLVLAFDQFEEFFVRFADQPEATGGVRRGEELDREARLQRSALREGFIREIGHLAAATDLNLRLVFSLREDWIAEMRALAAPVPGITQQTYRLLPLTSFGVRQVIVETLRSSQATFDGRLISALVENLADVHFDPAVLQLYCSEVWEKARARTPPSQPVRLSLEDLSAVGGVREIFRGYLDQIQREIGPGDLRHQVQTRAVLDALIREKRTKFAAPREYLLEQYFAISEHELDEVLARLCRLRIVRSDPRGGTAWFELVHERLVSLIVDWLDTDRAFFDFRGARELVVNSCHNRGWRQNPDLLLNRGQLDVTVGPFKELIRFNEEERQFLVASAITAESAELDYWAQLAGDEVTFALLERALDPAASDAQRCHGAAAAGRIGRRAQRFAGRCLALAQCDPDPQVRQVAARAFADLAGPEDFQLLASALRQRPQRQAALEVLIEAIDKDRVPKGIDLGRRRLRQAKKGLFRRRLERARTTLRERGARGARAGLLAASLWSLTAGPLLVCVALYSLFPMAGVAQPWLWPVCAGGYLLLALPLGAWKGRGAARRATRLVLRPGRGGGLFRTLAGGLGMWLGLAAWLGATFALLARYSPGEPIWPAINRDSAVTGFGFIAAFPVWVIVWSALITVVARPAIRQDGKRRDAWIWAWLWAFGGSLFPPLLLWAISGAITPWLDRLGRGASRPEVFGVMTAMTILVACVAIAALGGIAAFASLAGLALSMPHEQRQDSATARPGAHAAPSVLARRVSRSVAVLLALATVVGVGWCFGLDSFPFLARHVILGNQVIEIPAAANRLGPFKTLHRLLYVPATGPGVGAGGPPSPRLAMGSSDWNVYTPRLGELGAQAMLVLQPGELRWLAFQTDRKHPDQPRIWPDQPFTLGELAPADHHLAVVRLAAQGGRWSGSLLGQRSATPGQPLHLSIGSTAQGGAWCDGAALSLVVRGVSGIATNPLGLLCKARPERVDFAPDAPWQHRLRGNQEFVISAWPAPAELQHGGTVDGGAIDIDGVFATIAQENPQLIPGSSHSVVLWSKDGSQRLSALEHDAPVRSVCFSSDGKSLATAAGDVVRIWPISRTGTPVSLQHGAPVRWARFGVHDTRVAAASGNNVYLWKIASSASPRYMLLEHPSPVSIGNFSPDGAYFVTSDANSTVRFWSVESGKRLANWHMDELNTGADPLTPLVKAELARFSLRVNAIAWSPNGKAVAVALNDGTVRLWDAVGSGTPIILRHGGPVITAAFAPDGKRLLTISSDGFAQTWTTSGSRLAVLPLASTAISDADFDGDQKRVAVVLGDGTARISNLDGSGEPIVLARGNKASRIRFSPDHDHVMVLAESGPALIWDVAHPLRSLAGRDLFLFVDIGPGATADP